MSLGDFIAELDAQDQQRKPQQSLATTPTGPTPVSPEGDGAGGGGAPQELLTPPGEPVEQGAAPIPPESTPPAKPTTWGDRIRGLLGSVPRVPGNVIGGVLDFGGDVVRGNPLAAPGEDPSKLTSGQRLMLGEAASTGNPLSSLIGLGFAFNGHAADALSFKESLGKIGDPTWNQVSTELLSLAVGTGEVAVAARLTKLPAAIETISSPVLRGSAKAFLAASEGAVAQGVLLNPEQERLSNVLQSMGLDTAFTDYLAHTDDESRAEGRWKNAVEGVLTGVAAESLFRVGRYWVKSLKGDAKGAEEIAQEIGHEAPKEGPQETIEEVPASEIKPSDRSAGETKPSGPITWERGEDGTLRAVEDTGEGGAPGGSGSDPNARGPGDGSSPGGRTGTGDGTAVGEGSPPPPDAVLFRFKGAGTAGEGAPIGATTRHDLQALGEDISIWRATAEFAGRDATNVTREFTPEAADRVGEFHIAPLGSVDNVAPLLRAFVDRLPDSARRSDTDLFRTAIAVVRDVGEDPNSMVEAGRLISGKLQDADTAMVVLRSFWTRAAKDIDELNVPGVDWESVADEDFAKAAQAVHNMTTLSTYVQQAKQALGRGLRVNQLPDAQTYLGSLAKAGEEVSAMEPREMSPLPRSRDELKNWLELWQATKGDPVGRAKMLSDLLTVPAPGKYLRTSFANLFTANILSGPKTVLLHILGPSLLNTVRAVERLSGASAAALNPLLSSEERAAARVVAAQTVPAYFQNLTDIGSVFSQAWNAAKVGDSTLGGHSYFDVAASRGPLTQNLLRATGAEPDWRYSLGNLINVWPRFLSRTLTGLNEFSKRVTYQGDVRVKAMVEASQQGLTGDTAHAYVRDAIAGSLDEVGRATDNNLLRAAEMTTLTASPGAEGSWTRKFASGLNQMRRDVPELRYIVPVFNVPANALGGTLRRLPIAFMPGFGKLFPETASALEGSMGPVMQAEAHGRFLTGAAFLTAGMLLNRAGLLTGAGPESPADRKVWLMEHQPYSIRIGDSWVSYDRIEILGGLLSIPATIADATIHRSVDRASENLLLSGTAALAEWFRDRASLQNAAALLGAGESPMDNVGAFATKLAGNTISGLLVPRAIQSLVTDQIDPIARMRTDWTDYLRSAIPGLSKTAEPVRNVLGEPVHRGVDSFPDALFPIMIAPAVTFKTDPTVDEIDRLYQATGYAAGVDPHNIGSGFFNPKDVKLEDGHSIFDHFMQARQTMRVNGYTLREALADLFQSDDYSNAVDADPGQRTTSLGDASRGWMVQRVFERYNDAIKAELATSSTRANAYLTAAAAKQRDDAFLRDVTADDLVNTPGLYQARGINAEAYSSKLQAGSTGALAEALGVQQQP